MTEENLSTINYLTDEQYNQAKKDGTIKENELYLTPDESEDKSLKFATVKFTKNANQTFSSDSDSYDNNITFQNVQYFGQDSILKDIIYLDNGLINVSERVKKIDVNFNCWTESSMTNINFEFGLKESNDRTVLYGTQNNQHLDFSKAITQKTNLRISIYQRATIQNNNWTYCLCTIAYI